MEALGALRLRLDRELVGRRYGEGFEHVAIDCSFSNHDDPERTVRWEYFHDEEDLPKRPPWRCFVRPRLDLGKLTRHDDRWRWRVVRHFTRAEGELPLGAQKRLFGEDLRAILVALADRLARKKVRYDVERLRADLDVVLSTW